TLDCPPAGVDSHGYLRHASPERRRTVDVLDRHSEPSVELQSASGTETGWRRGNRACQDERHESGWRSEGDPQLGAVSDRFGREKARQKSEERGTSTLSRFFRR